ncbi:tetratricopeptide repeat protein [Streptomyces sp. NPDC046866]|uniref:tetratricopeptide repeat protein n=1 Tax=Streptomyces sp. NPDC046866 TaxID=3154921 RepID=UPI0034572B7B
MTYREIEDADPSLPRSTVHGLLGPADKRAGRECTGKLERLVTVLLARAAPDDPAAAPWRDRAAWQRRWEELDDRGRSDALLAGTPTGGALGWDGPLERAGMGADTELAWLTGSRLPRIAAVIGELSALGLYRRAHDVAREFLRCAEETLPPQDPGMLAARHVAAYWAGEAGEVRRARDLTARLGADCLDALGADHPLTRLSALRLAAWTTGAGDPAQGRRLYRELARNGPDDRITLLARLGGAGAAHLAGDTDESLDRLAALLPDLRAEYGEHHAVVLAARMQQVRGRRRMGERGWSCSLELLDGLVREASEHLGPAHPLTLYVRGRHARAVGSHGDWPRALELAEETYREAVRVNGPDHPDSLTVGNSLAVILARSDAQASEVLFRELHGRARDRLGDDHYRTLRIAHNLTVVVHSHDPAAARPLYEEVREARVRVLGADHPDTLLTRFSIAHTVLLLEGGDAARPLFEEVHRARARVLGPQRPDTLRVLRYLGGGGPAVPELPGDPPRPRAGRPPGGGGAPVPRVL